jgi:hypothetical protein
MFRRGANLLLKPSQVNLESKPSIFEPISNNDTEDDFEKKKEL